MSLLASVGAALSDEVLQSLNVVTCRSVLPSLIYFETTVACDSSRAKLLAVLAPVLDAAERELAEGAEWKAVLLPKTGAFGPDTARKLLQAANDEFDRLRQRAESAEAQLLAAQEEIARLKR